MEAQGVGRRRRKTAHGDRRDDSDALFVFRCCDVHILLDIDFTRAQGKLKEKETVRYIYVDGAYRGSCQGGRAMMAEPVANWWLWILLVVIVFEILLWLKEIKKAIRKRKKLKNTIITLGYGSGFFAILWAGMFTIFMFKGGIVLADTPIPTISEWILDCAKWATISSIVVAPILAVIVAYSEFKERRRKK